MRKKNKSPISLLTGIPRSGTTLCCNLLNQCDNTVALHEPINPQKLQSTESASAVAEIASQIDKIRNLLETNQAIEHGDKTGIDLDNPVGVEANEKGLRKQRASRGKIVLPPIDSSTTLVVKQNALFTALASELKHHYNITAIVRNPVDVLLSWMTVDLPVNKGRLPAGEKYDRLLAEELGKGAIFERQLFIYRWFINKFSSAKLNVVRYEDILATNGNALFSAVGLAHETSLKPVGRDFPKHVLTVLHKNWETVKALGIEAGYSSNFLEERLSIQLDSAKTEAKTTEYSVCELGKNLKQKGENSTLKIGIDDKGSHNSFGGYGQLAREMIKAIIAKYDAKIIGKPIKNVFDEKYYQKSNVNDYDKYFDVVYHISSPKDFKLNKNCKNIIYTQNALGDLKPTWVNRLKDFDHIIVPGEFDRHVFARYFGSVSSCPQLIDNKTFKPVPKWRSENSNEFTFLFVGTIHYRKGFDLLIKSLSSAADKLQQNIKLKCLAETSNIITYLNYFADLNAQRSKFLNIEYTVNSITPPWMNRFYNRSDAFITLSRGEGWCMPAHEATLAGLPIIVPNSTAFKEYLSFLPSVLSVDVNELNFDSIAKTPYNKSLIEGYYTPENIIYECDVDHAASRICELIENYSSYKDKAKESSRIIKEKYNQTTFLEHFSDCLQKFELKRTPL